MTRTTQASFVIPVSVGIRQNVAGSDYRSWARSAFFSFLSKKSTGKTVSISSRDRYGFFASIR